MTDKTRKGRSRSDANKGLSPLAALVRRHDRDRYLTALFAPGDKREALLALYAFNYEVARVRESVSEPMLGQIRLQWWREVVAAADAGAPPRAHQVAAPLAAAIRTFAMTRRHFDRLIDAREGDLADDAPAGLAALVDYAEATSAGLVHLALEILGVRQPAAAAAARHVGIAYALTGLLRAMPFHAGSGRRYIPQEVAAAEGLDLGDYARLRASPALRRAVATIGDAAAGQLAAAREQRGEVTRRALPALLPAVVAEHTLAQLRRADWDPFDRALAAPDPLLGWRLAAAMLCGRF